MANSSASSSTDPHATYQSRLLAFRQQEDQLQRRVAWLGNSRFALFGLGIALFLATVAFRLASPLWLIVPAVVFLFLSMRYQQATARSQRVRRAVDFYERGLARLEDRWAGKGVSGANYLDESHPYAADLDLFGANSLFERLCDARTRIGRDMLARWLLAPATPDEVRARQEAVRELSGQLPWREQLALLGTEVPDGIDTDGLAAWGRISGKPSPGARLLAPFVLGLTLLSLFAYMEGWTGSYVIVLALLVQGGFALLLRPRVNRALAGLEVRSGHLFQLAGLLTSIESATFTAPRLRQLQAALQTGGQPPSKRLAQLVRLIEMLDSRHNTVFGLAAPLILWTTQIALAVEDWRARTGPALQRWLEVIGEVEALTNLAGYAYENPSDLFPEIVTEGPLFDAIALGHPLLPRQKCITNDVRLDMDRRLLVVSGSNMSGKSTFLRTVGISAVLALAGAPVRAAQLRVSPLALGATLRIQDSLMAGKSRFYAEITRLKQIVELTQGPLPVLFLLDEILHGTNSHDRRIGAEAVLRALLQRPSLGMVTTHDLALTQIAELLAPLAANVHFADILSDGKLDFDYRLHPGVVQHSNALALMRAVGLSVDDATDQ